MTAPRLGDRVLFPHLTARAYLAHCAISPVSAPVRAAVDGLLDRGARLGLGALPETLAERARLRQGLAALVGASPDDLALVANTTTGVILVANGLAWRPGDRVLTFDGEFPANVTPWARAAETFGLTHVRLPLAGFGAGRGPTGDGLARLEAALREGVRLAAVSAVQFQTGLAMPLAEIAALCRRYGAELFVDAIQGVGVVPVDVRALGVDYLSCGSHKWLMGIEGCAFLYVAPERAPLLVPRLAGWLSHEDPVGFLGRGPGALTYDRPIRPRADAFEGGAANGAGLAALGAAVDVVQALGVPAIHAYVQAWHDRVEGRLVERGFRSLRAAHPDGRSGILALLPPDGVDAQALVRALGAEGIVVTAPDGHLRLAPSWPNALGEAELLLAAVDRALA